MPVICNYGLLIAIMGLALFLCFHVHLMHFFTLDPLGSTLMCYLFSFEYFDSFDLRCLLSHFNTLSTQIIQTNFCCIPQVSYNWMFFVGMGPVFVSFFAVAFLTYYETWDPVLLAVKKLLQCLCRRRFLPGSR